MNIHFIGGEGKMGKVHVPLFRAYGHQVQTSDERTLDSLSYTRAADMTLASVPLPALQEIVYVHGPHARAFADFSSVQGHPCALMKTYCTGEWMSLHPLYGPDIPSLNGRALAVSGGSRAGALCEQLLHIFRTEGAQLHYIDPQIHDKVVSGILQTLRTRMLHAYGTVLAHSGIELETTYSLSPPPAQCLLELLARQSTPDAAQTQHDIAAYHRFGTLLMDHFMRECERPSLSPEQLREAFGEAFFTQCITNGRKRLY